MMFPADRALSIRWPIAITFAVLGIVTAFFVTLRLNLGVPAADATFPGRGLVVLSPNFLPSGGSVLTTRPGMIRGLEFPHLLSVAAIVAANGVTIALATCITCWRISEATWVPPRKVVGRMIFYALATGMVGFGGLVLTATWSLAPAVLALELLGASTVLFLAPAVLVFERTPILTGIRRAGRLFVDRPALITLLAVGIGYLGYLCTAITTLLGAESVLAYALGAAVSTTLAGTVHVVALAWAYTTLTDAASAAKSTPGGSIATDD